MTSQVPADVLSAENKNPVMLLNERRRALKWEERFIAQLTVRTL